MQLVIGVKDPGYGQNNNWKLDPADFVDVDPAKESVELELGDKYDGKLIDKLTLALKKVGASITIDRVVFVKRNGEEENQSTTASGEVKQVTATPWFEFTKWNQQYLCNETCTLLTYTKSAEESQKYVIEFAEPTKDKLQWLPTAVTAGGVEVPAYIGIPVGSEKAELELNSEFEFTKDEAPIEWTSIKSIALQSDCADGVTQTVKIKSAKRIITNTTDIPRYTFDLANLDFSAADAKAIGGWNGKDKEGFKSEIKDGVDVITFTKQAEPTNVQVDFENVYPKGAKIQLTMVAKGSVEGSIKAGLQNPDNYEGECGNFEDIDLTTDYQTFTRTVTCSGDNARLLLLNVGNYNGPIYIKSVKIEALDVPQETVTISSSGYSTYAAYYPVDYSKLGLTAYTVKLNAEKTGIVMDEVKGVVSAGVPVLLKGMAKTPYRLPKVEGWVWAEPSDFKLSDGTATSTAEKTVYGLATVGDKDGFYKASAGKTIPAKCAYLVVETSANPAKFYSLGDHSGSTTGITSVKNEAAGNNAPMYNLAGQLVDKGYKGIVIKNGKKIVLK